MKRCPFLKITLTLLISLITSGPLASSALAEVDARPPDARLVGTTLLTKRILERQIEANSLVTFRSDPGGPLAIEVLIRANFGGGPLCLTSVTANVRRDPRGAGPIGKITNDASLQIKEISREEAPWGSPPQPSSNVELEVKYNLKNPYLGTLGTPAKITFLAWNESNLTPCLEVHGSMAMEFDGVPPINEEGSSADNPSGADSDTTVDNLDSLDFPNSDEGNQAGGCQLIGSSATSSYYFWTMAMFISLLPTIRRKSSQK